MKRLLVVKLGDIGDAILATPALRALHTTWPEAEIDVLCSATGASALEGLPGLHELIVVNKQTLDRPAGLLDPRVALAALKQAGRLRSRRYDVKLIFHHLFTRWGSLKYEWLARAVGARRTTGLADGRVGFLTDRCGRRRIRQPARVRILARGGPGSGRRQLVQLFAPRDSHRRRSIEPRRPDCCARTARRRL